MNERDLIELLQDFRQEVRERFDRIECILYGNGQEGLVREVTKNTEFRERFEGRYRIILGAALSAFFSGLAALVRSFLR